METKPIHKSSIVILILMMMMIVLIPRIESRQKQKKQVQTSTLSSILIYNRIPKTGSYTLLEALKGFGSRRAGGVDSFGVFKYGNDGARLIKTRFNSTEKKKLRDKVSQLASSNLRSVLWLQHMTFIPLKRLNNGNTKSIYINIVRDPIERFISWFYYMRKNWPSKVLQAHKDIMIDSGINNDSISKELIIKKGFEGCVLNEDIECLFISGQNSSAAGMWTWSQLQYFCGTDVKCLNSSDQFQLQQAKQNVLKYYSVVGVTEEMKKSFKVFEALVPEYFHAVHAEGYNGIQKKNVNKSKPLVSDWVKNLLRTKLSNEFEFYEFCKQRLYLQYNKIHS